MRLSALLIYMYASNIHKIEIDFSNFFPSPWLKTRTWRVHLCWVCVSLSGEGAMSGSFPVEGNRKRVRSQRV